MQKLLTFFSKNISVYSIFNNQSFNNTLTNHMVSFEQMGPDIMSLFWPSIVQQWSSLALAASV